MKIQVATVALVLIAAAIFALSPAVAQNGPPKYDVDPFWPMPLPDRWVVGQLGAVCIDQQDHVFVLNRQDVKDEELDAGRLAPPVFELDPEGKVVNSWGDPKELPRGLHGCAVDKDNNVWIVGEGSGIAHKYSHDGKPLAQIGREELRLSGIGVDRQNGDVYVTSGRTNPGVSVFDRSGQLLRQWKIRRTEAEKDIVSNVHCIGKSEDGLVYVCDRLADRLQVFDAMGNFKKQIVVPWTRYTAPDGKRKTGEYGSASMLAFSRDPAQKWLYVINENNEQINVLDRDTGKVLSTFGRGAGHFIGQFTHGHSIAVDSKGNVYVSETDDGKRIQKFKVVGR